MSSSLVREDCRKALDGRHDALSDLRGETIVVLGGTGFMGTWVAEALACLNDDFGFACRIVLMARGVERFTAEKQHLSSRPDLKLVRTDIRHLAELPRETNRIVHAAASPDNRFHATSPVETMTTIAEGTANVLRVLNPLGDLRRFLYLSSGYVYGAQPWSLPAVPESFAGSPALGTAASAYAEAKRCAETLCASGRSEFRIPATIARPFAFLGPYQALDTPWAANNFLLDALLGRPIRIQGDGETVRSYMYASDMAYWILRLLTAENADGAWNLGSDNAVTLRELARMIAQQFQPSPEIRLHSAAHGTASRTRFVPSVSAAQKNFGLEIRVPLGEAIERTVLWHKSTQTFAAGRS